MSNKLDINKNPERFSSFERAINTHNRICDEFGFNDWKLTLPATKETIFLGCTFWHGVGYTALFLEGFMSALAYCSGSISGGRLRELTREADCTQIDEFALNNFAQTVMTNQTLWNNQQAEIDRLTKELAAANERVKLAEQANEMLAGNTVVEFEADAIVFEIGRAHV